MEAERGGRSALAATRASRVEAPVQVPDRRVELRLWPVLAHCRHLPGALVDDLGQGLGVSEQRVGRDVRPDAALCRKAVALRADADEGLFAERRLVRLARAHP